MGTSVTTGESYYSGDWSSVAEVCRVLNIGDGKMTMITQEMVEHYQERIDREIDSVLGELYETPFIAKNQIQPDGTKKAVFPGEIRYAALYWTAGSLMANEFQGLDPNTNEAVNVYIEDSRRKIFQLRRFTTRLRGAERRSNYSRSLPSTMQPPAIVEPDF